MSKKSDVPNHLSLILDGNRRWAKSKGLPTFAGHRKGYQNLKDTVDYAIEKGVHFVTAFIFSTENWKRSVKEVNFLMDLAYKMVTKDISELHRKNIKALWLGSHDGLSPKMLTAISKAEELTKNNTAGTFGFCFNYSGQQEIADALKNLIKQKVDAAKVTTKLIEKSLYAPEVPPIDMVIRTSGEQRISNFMIWRLAYSEIYFSSKLWPDFGKKDFDDALDFYAGRDRRFGQ
ncbi:MAG TPA: polyprenyl diphosphate synthase [Candidatus Saccharimonadales bacterium]|nr:polyprenyl diphosphate synthase [Candidatus Saccharimonadales bacterium]